MKLLKLLNNHLEEYILVLLLIAEVIVVFAQVVTRYVFKYPLPWSEEIARYMFIWMVWVGAAYGTKENKNICIDVLSSKFEGPAKKISEALTFVLFVCLMLFMMYTSGKVTMQVYNSHSHATGSGLPMWIVWFSLPLSMTLMLFRFVQNSVLKRRAKKEEENQ